MNATYRFRMRGRILTLLVLEIFVFLLLQPEIVIYAIVMTGFAAIFSELSEDETSGLIPFYNFFYYFGFMLTILSIF